MNIFTLYFGLQYNNVINFVAQISPDVGSGELFQVGSFVPLTCRHPFVF